MKQIKLTIKPDFFKIIMLGLPQPLSKANLRQTRVKIKKIRFWWLAFTSMWHLSCRRLDSNCSVFSFLKIRILIRCLKQGSFSQQSNAESQERCEPCVVRVRPPVPPQGLQTWIFDFSHKGTGAKSVDMATTQKLSICFPSIVIYISVAEFGKHCCKFRDMFSIQCFTFLICIIQKRK